MHRFRVSGLRGGYWAAQAQQIKLPDMIHPFKCMASASQAYFGARARQIKLTDKSPSLK